MTNTTNFNSLMKQSWSGVAVLSIFYIVIVIGLSLMSPWFFSFNNAMNIGINMSYIGLMAAAGTPLIIACLLYTSPSPRDAHESRMPSSA